MSLLKKNEIPYNDIPDSLNLETGVYPETAVSSAKIITNKKTELSSILIEFKDVDPDSETFGLPWAYFISIPDPSKMDAKKVKETAVRYKQSLKRIGLTDYQIENLDDPEMDADSKEWLLEIEGILQLKKNGDFTNMVAFERTSANGTVEAVSRPKREQAEEKQEETAPAKAQESSNDDWD